MNTVNINTAKKSGFDISSIALIGFLTAILLIGFFTSV
jgi:hypothetical protein